MIKTLIKLLFFLILFFLNPVSFESFFDKDGETDLVLKSIILLIDFFVIIIIYFLFYFKKNFYYFEYKIKILSFNIIFIIFGIIIIELYFGNWIKNKNLNHLNITKNAKYEFSINNLYDSKDSIIYYIRDQYGFRGNYPNPSKINFLTLGGSTTAQKYISEGQTWQDVLQNLYLEDGKEIYVVNAGIDGQSTLGHIVAFEDWFTNVPNLKVDYFLIYFGINDFLLDDSSPNYGRDYLIYDDYDKTFLSLLYNKSALMFAIQRIQGIYSAKKRNARHERLKLSGLKWVKDPILSDLNTEYQPYLDRFEKRLKMLIDKIERFGSRAIIVSHSANGLWKKKGNVVLGIEPKYCGSINGKKYNGVDYYYMKNILNDKAMEICKEMGSLYIDIDKNLQFDIENDLYDVMHNTPEGSKRIGNLLYQKLKILYTKTT